MAEFEMHRPAPLDQTPETTRVINNVDNLQDYRMAPGPSLDRPAPSAVPASDLHFPTIPGYDAAPAPNSTAQIIDAKDKPGQVVTTIHGGTAKTETVTSTGGGFLSTNQGQYYEADPGTGGDLTVPQGWDPTSDPTNPGDGM